jgi:hypothetical protein
MKADPATRSNRTALRHSNPDRVPSKIPDAAVQPAKAVDRVFEQYTELKRQHGLPVAFDRDDVELVGRYLAHGDGASEGLTWRRLEEGGSIGASWLVHELTEVRLLLGLGIDIFSDAELDRAYPSAHGHALIVEHRYLYDIALEKRYTIRELGSLIRFNPTVPERQAEWDFDKAVSQDLKLNFDDRDEPEVKKFFRELL